MIARALVRRLRTYLSDAQTQRLRAQLTEASDRNRLLDERLATLQAANEGAYRELEKATGGARFDSEQPLGSVPPGGLFAWTTQEEA
ncbi:hypothetical protein [Streptomyces sp. T028]|uniref:hypothetical protein n=1 Tax=Streptomyces sp. T028 TaxID=3394379 RepID=UPI003A8C220C